MPYSQPHDLIKKYNKVLSTELVPDEVARKIDFADAIIDSALAYRYIVPFAQAPGSPPIINYVSSTIALRELLDRGPETVDWVVREGERAWEILQKLANGEMAVVGVGGTVVPQNPDIGTIRSSTADYTPTFGVAPSISEGVDPDRAEDESTAREPL